MPARNSTPPTPQEIGDRIVRNLDKVRGFLKVLQDEIRDPQKSGHGDRKEWQHHAEKLDENLSELRNIVDGDDEDIDS